MRPSREAEREALRQPRLLGFLLDFSLFAGAAFAGAVFAGAVFAGAAFAGAAFAGAVFAGAAFAGAAFAGAAFAGAAFAGTGSLAFAGAFANAGDGLAAVPFTETGARGEARRSRACRRSAASRA